jgi:hypothetical protein
MPAKRVLISIDDRLLARIDEAAMRSGRTRSGYLAGLASADLDGDTGPGSDPRARDALAAIERILGERDR